MIKRSLLSFMAATALVLGVSPAMAETPADSATYTMAFVRLGGVQYNAKTGVDAARVGVPFSYWVVTPSTPIPGGSEVIDTRVFGGSRAPGLVPDLSATEARTMNRGGGDR